MIPTPTQPVGAKTSAPSPVPPTSTPINKPTTGALQPIVTAGLLIGKHEGVTAASGKKSQRTAIIHESKHMHGDATKMPKK
jgi:hypothetical protein